MGTVYIEDLQPGMVLASDARSRQGRLLFSEGIGLDELSIQTLKFWGVTEVAIQGQSQAELDRKRLELLGPERAQAYTREAAQRLRLSGTAHPAAEELARVAVIQMIQSGHAPQGSFSAPRPTPPVAAARTPDPRKRPSIAKLTSGAGKLATLPQVVIQTLEALKNPNVSYGYVASIIGKDTALSAKLLKLVNSALYSFPEPVETIDRAVTVVGANRLTSLALGVSMISYFSDIPRDILDMRSFWKHCLSCGVLARLLAVTAGHPNEERCFVAGLLHDVGRLIMLKNHPALVAQAIALAEEEDISLAEAEREAWGFDHAALGSRLLQAWRFPPALEHAVADHHAYDPRTSSQDAALVHLADLMAHTLHMGASGAPAAPPLIPEAWEQMNIPLSALGAAAAQGERQLDDIGHILLDEHG
ncbi:HDOD domain-containing protein [Fundidesulfovibrio agrisoli]|uniref:HDOD domain-containing protein n=1 Tax=Fundidesulfovibrio agrisoli TaxID=2922717 RepID=UPI001FACBD81|nr:HDOD domain-containing protein [Fundidesulfovibrio agrisoli]